MLHFSIYQDIAGTLAMEEAEDAAQVTKLRSALESVDHKRRKVLHNLIDLDVVGTLSTRNNFYFTLLYTWSIYYF